MQVIRGVSENNFTVGRSLLYIMVLSGKSKLLVVSRSNLCTMNSVHMLGRGKGGKVNGKAKAL